jgi:hypothetical protein
MNSGVFLVRKPAFRLSAHKSVFWRTFAEKGRLLSRVLSIFDDLRSYVSQKWKTRRFRENRPFVFVALLVYLSSLRYEQNGKRESAADLGSRPF